MYGFVLKTMVRKIQLALTLVLYSLKFKVNRVATNRAAAFFLLPYCLLFQIKACSMSSSQYALSVFKTTLPLWLDYIPKMNEMMGQNFPIVNVKGVGWYPKTARIPKSYWK